MIQYALIVRTLDGLALSASTDRSPERGADGQEARKLMKALARQVGKQEDRCTVKLYTHLIHFVTGYGVTIMALCDPTYPAVLAFSFLNDIQKEFISVYDAKQIQDAVRPYAFIEFDSVIQKARQRYNSPRTLSTRLNLSDLSTELTLRPAKQLVIQDVLPALSKNGPVLPSSDQLALTTSKTQNMTSVASIVPHHYDVNSMPHLMASDPGIPSLSIVADDVLEFDDSDTSPLLPLAMKHPEGCAQDGSARSLDIGLPESDGSGSRLPSLTGFHISVLCLNSLLCLFCLYRGISMLGASTLEEPEGTNPLHGLVFLLEAGLSVFQVVLLLQSILLRRELSLVSFGLRILCTLSMWSLQDWWQSLFQILAAFLATLCVFLRSPDTKKPNYNV